LVAEPAVATGGIGTARILRMKIRTECKGEVAVVRPIGRFAGGVLDFQLRDSVAAAIASGARHVVLDLADLARVDSTGIGELVGAYAAARKRGASLALARLSPGVAGVLAASRLGFLFSIHQSVDGALAAAQVPDDRRP
jgi:anti-sigma B factor antagonist